VTGAIAGITLIDLLTAVQATRTKDIGSVPAARSTRKGGTMELTATTTIRKPATEVYAFWRDFSNLPRFMQHLESVETRDERHSHWKAKAPAGSAVEWDAVVIEDVPSSTIAWRSEGSTSVPNSGAVKFAEAPAGQGTEVTISIEVQIPAGAAGKLTAKLFGEDPQQQVRDDLRHFKQILETGEIVSSEANPSGSQLKRFVKQRAAQPLTERELATVGGGQR
jgi:uncharacterized membrane protein